MKKGPLLLAVAGATLVLPAVLAAPHRATKRQSAPFFGVNFAHRGLHTRDMSVPENSIKAFREAARAGYGIELDVHLSKDGQVVVFHDDTLDRVCGVNARVEELDYAELSQLRLYQTDQTIPLFSEVLSVVRGRSPLIIELKSGRRNRELCEKTYALLENYKGDVCIESFNPFIVSWFRFNARDIVRGQLAMPAEYYETMKKPLALILSNTFLNVLTRPQFIAHKIGKRSFGVRLAEALGAMIIVWTSHEPRNELNNDGVIFEYYKPKPKFR